ncbi:MAG: HAMP domain-containing histidine kinase [Alphaproteobacteria bacterium]|nr:HAMP domain-containing histidine kinase [Alphaproteobacteria bacterium]
MSTPPRPVQRLASLSTWALAVLVVVLTAATLWASVALESRRSTEARVRRTDALEGAVALWESLQLDRIDDGLAALALDPDRPAPGWADARWRWRAGSGGAPGELLAPRPGPVEDTATLLQDPCLARAAQETGVDRPRVEIAESWARCLDAAPPVARLAASRAAEQFMAAGEPARALQVLAPPSDSTDGAAAEGPTDAALPAFRVLTGLLQRAQAHQALGEDDRATALLVQAGDEIVQLHGPDLADALPLLDYPVLADLRALGAVDDADRLAGAGALARRRLAGWRSVDTLLSRPEELPAPVVAELSLPDGRRAPVRAIGQPVGEARHLLAWAELPDGQCVGLQADPREMLDELVASDRDGSLRVLDAAGQPLALDGAASPEPGADALADAPTVAFGRLFPALRLARVDSASPATSAATSRILMVASSTTVLVLTAFLIIARLRADRQQHELWERQQGFVHRVSHELKTPLAGVKVMAEMIEMGMVTTHEELEQTAQRIISEVSRMEDRVNEVLKQAKRPEIVEAEPVDIRAMAEHLADVWAPRFEQRGARLTVELAETGTVNGDRQLLRDAISNLLDNALKYLREDRPGTCRMRVGAGPRWVVVEVADNGIGVPEHMRKAVFGRFTRVEGDGRGKAGGHGLGLSFVAEAVAQHGGKVECREGIAGGARFIIRLRRTR